MAATGTDRLTPFEEARELILARARRLDAEPVPLREALGRVTAADVRASAPVPGFDNSAMDGFAVRAADLAGAGAAAPVTLVVVDESRAGHPASRPVGAGEAIAISTGAVLPAGADAVVMVEKAERAGDTVKVAGPIAAGTAVRRAGDDVAAGELVLPAGTPVGPAELGVLAELGVEPVPCRRRPRLAVVVSGDELVGPTEPLAPGQIRDANAHTLRALAERAGAEVVAEARVGDDPDATRAALAAALAGADLVVISGGISVGAHDHVKGALAELGVEQVFWRIAFKPGKPTWFGVAEDDGPLVLGLPGNPVSAMVCFTLLAWPAIRAMLGVSAPPRRTVAILDDECEREPNRLHAVRCRLALHPDGWHAHSTGAQASHVLTSMVGAEAVALIPAGDGPLGAGEEVEVELLPYAQG
ncbi:MAG TPA: gephyrin-like molybdotransferase Glp [Solirubrobacterales bacterium]|nr:gephyrin-like molybdotransferase Glp [Solirubrobacterales bacterium]